MQSNIQNADCTSNLEAVYDFEGSLVNGINASEIGAIKNSGMGRFPKYQYDKERDGYVLLYHYSQYMRLGLNKAFPLLHLYYLYPEMTRLHLIMALYQNVLPIKILELNGEETVNKNNYFYYEDYNNINTISSVWSSINANDSLTLNTDSDKNHLKYVQFATGNANHSLNKNELRNLKDLKHSDT